jgi:uncharacterized protein
MNVHATPKIEAELSPKTKLRVADCDLHPVPNTLKDLYPFLEKRWRDHLESFGARRRQGIYQGVMPGRKEAGRAAASS